MKKKNSHLPEFLLGLVLIETEIHPESSDHILTLSTCTGNGYDSRMTDRPCRVYRRTDHRPGKTILKLLSG